MSAVNPKSFCIESALATVDLAFTRRSDCGEGGLLLLLTRARLVELLRSEAYSI